MKTQGKKLLYPDRQRCLECRRLFGLIVIQRKFCAYYCAGLPGPVEDVNKAPRECVTGTVGNRRWKRRFLYPGEVPARLLNEPSGCVYECNNCHMYHFGHRRPESNGAGTSHKPADHAGGSCVKAFEGSLGTAAQGSDC